MDHKEKIKKDNIKNYYKNKYKNTKIIKQYHHDIQNNIIKKIFNNVSKRTCKELKKQNIERNFKYSELLGCDLQEFESNLKSKFKEKMNFVN